MILRFNEREIDTEEYHIAFEEGCRLSYGDESFAEAMHLMDITEDEVDFSADGGDDGLPESADIQIYSAIISWVSRYNDKVLEPYNDKETNILIQDTGEEGIQLLFLYCHDLSADSEDNEEQFAILEHLFGSMQKNDPAYKAVAPVMTDYQEGRLVAEETYVLLKIRFRDKYPED